MDCNIVGNGYCLTHKQWKCDGVERWGTHRSQPIQWGLAEPGEPPMARENRRLKDALFNFGDHKTMCAQRAFGKECNCGWDELRRSLQ